MARETGDLWPQSSGSASLGAEMANGGFTGAVRPFAHVHMNSGVFHNGLGVSGIIRFQKAVNAFDFDSPAFGLSFNGGKDYPLEISTDQNIGDLSATIAIPYGDLVLFASGDLGLVGDSIGMIADLGDAGLAAEGNINISAFGNSGVLNYQFGPHQSWYIKQSHTSTGGPFNNGYWPIPHSGQIRAMVASGSIQKINGCIGPEITIVGTDNVVVATNFASNQITVSAPNITKTINGEFGDILINGVNGITFNTTGTSTFNINGASLSGLQAQYTCGDEISLVRRPALSPRGILLKYPVGARTSTPYDSIAVEHGYGIAVSGFSSTPTNISSYGIAMLDSNSLDIRGSGSSMPNLWLGIDNARQSAHIATSGVLRIGAGSGVIVTECKTTFASSGIAPLNISGIYTRPTTQLVMGDTFMMAHSALEDIGAATQATDLATARARSLGLATLAYNTGSGIINISVGSGIMQCLNSAVMKVTTATQTLPLVAASPCSDHNYHIGTGLSSGIITILTPGLYKADYKVFSFKDTGTNPQTVQTNATLNNSNILGSFINSFHFDSTNAKDNSASVSVLFNAYAGDQFRLISSSTLAGADNCTIALRGALLILQKIGPRRLTF